MQLYVGILKQDILYLWKYFNCWVLTFFINPFMRGGIIMKFKTFFLKLLDRLIVIIILAVIMLLILKIKTPNQA